MDITIHGTVRNSEKDEVKISIHSHEIEQFIKSKAVALGVEGYQGEVWTHFDETITSVVIID